MAGNAEVYDDAMRIAANVAWDGDWTEAIESYRRALAEFPDDVDALSGLGMAYASAGRHKEALEAYRQASDLERGDPVLLERVGNVLEDLGRNEEAAQAYLASGRQYLDQQKAPRLAQDCWEAAVRLDPDCHEAHVELLKTYQRQGRTTDAVAECLALARIAKSRGRGDYAVRVCQHALQVSPENPDVLAALDELRRDEQVAIEREVKAPEGEHVRDEAHPPLKDIVVLDAATLEFEVPSEEVTGERGNPAEMTRRKALTELAESVFGEEENAATMGEGLGREAINALISRAIEAHARGREEEATAAYQRVIEAGAERPAVRFSLGLLYQERQRLGQAIAHFERAASDPDYALGSHFALGECYRAKGRIQDAVQHLIGALRAVDLGAVASELAGDLVTVYQHLAEDCLVSYDRGQAVRLADRLSALLTENGWEENLKRARERLDELTRGGPVVSLAEGLAIGGSGRILESLAVAQEHRRAGLFYTAMEDCHFALESSPNFLPTHWQLAEVALEMGKTDQAVEKFAVIADTYRVRGSAGRAAVTYERALQLAPMDTKVRARLIDLLADQDKVDQALTHYTKLAESHYHLAQMDRARETYQQALQLASRADDAREWKVQILERIGDIDMQRVDWSRASSVYEQIRNLAPGGESARFTLMELYYRQGRDRDAARELDGLLQAYREEGRSESVYAVLEKAVDRWPDAILLRARLAQAHLDAGDAERALEHLERLADLQLQAGREGEVKATVEAMIALDPTSADEYRELLERMETGNPPDRLAST